MGIESKLNIIKEYCQEFNDGDLLILSDINDELDNLLDEELGDSIVSTLYTIKNIINHLENVDSQEEFVNKILNFIKILETSPSNMEDEINELHLKEYIAEEEVVEEELYDFSNLIQDIDMLEKFYDEAVEHLNNAQVVLVELEYDIDNSEIINTIFRAFHTIKGSAAFLGIKNIEDVAHSVENMLSLVREGKIIVSAQLIDIIFYGIKFLEDLIRILPSCEYDQDRIISSFNVMKTRPIIELVDKIVSESEYKKLGEILEDMGKIDSTIVGEILKKQEAEGKRFGEILIDEKIVTPSDIDEAVKIQKQGKVQSSYVKVHSSRLNDLVDMVGELVVIQSMINQSAQLSDNVNLDKNIAQLTNISRGIKNIVLSMGMVPIGEIFNRLKIVIRNASRDLGKVINVTIVGEETELDRNLVEAIYDPLVHMVRNSADHGIEEGEVRIQEGKTDVGHIIISAEHKGNGIEISVEDDGQGIDKNKVINKAIEKKLITEDEMQWYQEHERECYMLMFKPGFSTKEEISELSGRGVGLDVVKQNIDSIRGKIDIQSSVGEGTKFTLRLPLTLAIIDGFVTQVDTGKFIFPFSAISEIVVPKDDQLDKMDSGEIILNNRGQFIPVFKANTIIKQAGGHITENTDSLGIILIITHENSQYGIGVDKVLGKQEIVIKSLNEILKNMELFSGGTIFGDGSIGFVVDIDNFLDKCS